MSWKTLLFWPDNPFLSFAVLGIVLVVSLYLARSFAHKLIRSLTHFVHNGLRLAARSIMLGEARLRLRNREVLVASGAEAMETKIEREFHRVNKVVAKDLQVYPAMHRSISELITVIDEDYRNSVETPPPPPEWVTAVDAVCKIQSSGDSMVANILEDIKKAANKHHKNAMSEYRKASGERHALLKKIAPLWRSMSNMLEKTDKSMKGILDRSANIDKQMEQYEQVIAKTDMADRMLSSSSFTQFFISSFFILIALGGVIVNFNLIALPLSEMVGAGSYIGPFKLNHFVALFIVLLESVCGVFLMESLHITHLFPIIGNLEDRKRRWITWSSLIMLVVFACIESSLAFMRDIIASKNLALLDTLAGVQSSNTPEMAWIPMVGQMVLGFMLPFVLAFVAIPFESFVHSARLVIGVSVAWFLRTVAFLLRLIGNVTLYMGNILINLYDLLAFPLLWVDNVVKGRAVKVEKKTPAATSGGNAK